MRVIAIGTRMPGWVTEGSDEYLKRMPRELSVEWVELSRVETHPRYCRASYAG